jgi:hypothetical protein
MKSIELTIQNLIGSGMDPKTENNPYLGFVYTSFQVRGSRGLYRCGRGRARGVLADGGACMGSGAATARLRPWESCGRTAATLRRRAAALLPTNSPAPRSLPPLHSLLPPAQERATKVSHGNTARHALEFGDELLAKMCGSIASDEGRHEIAYQRIVEKLYELDPDGSVMAFADMMRKQIVMPAHLMDDGEHATTNVGRNLFADFSSVAERSGVYTAFDYADIMVGGPASRCGGGTDRARAWGPPKGRPGRGPPPPWLPCAAASPARQARWPRRVRHAWAGIP